MEQQKFYDLAISQIHSVGPRTIRNLISYCGSSAAVFKSSKRQLLKIPGIGHEVLNKLKSHEVFQTAENTLKLMTEFNVDFHFFTSSTYPSRLKNFSDAPAGFFFKGNHPFNNERNVAIVGTRMPSPYGKKMTAKLVEELSMYAPTIISGLAIGIDTIAHASALKSALKTIGVLGQGFPNIYPSENRKLAVQMIGQGGLLSEFAFHKKPDPRHFPQRNRIIAMLADALIVVESKESGGSIISAGFANEYYKDVFALPGRSGDSKSIGCNSLIKNHLAGLIETGHDVAKAMSWDLESESTSNQKSLFIDLNPEEEKIFKILNEFEEVELDKLHYLSKIRQGDLSKILLNLEFQGLIKVLPGKKYMVS